MAEKNKTASIQPGLAGINKYNRYNQEGGIVPPSEPLEKCDEMIDTYNSCIARIKPNEIPENIPGMYAITKHNFSLYESILKRVPQKFIEPMMYLRAGGSCEYINIISDGHLFKLITDRLREHENYDGYFSIEDQEAELTRLRKQSNNRKCDIHEHIHEIHNLVSSETCGIYDVCVEQNAVIFGQGANRYSLSFSYVAERLFADEAPIIKNKDGVVVTDYKFSERTTDLIKIRLKDIQNIEIEKKCSASAIDRIEKILRDSTKIDYKNIDQNKLSKSFSRNDIKIVRFFHVSLDYLINPLNADWKNDEY